MPNTKKNIKFFSTLNKNATEVIHLHFEVDGVVCHPEKGLEIENRFYTITELKTMVLYNNRAKRLSTLVQEGIISGQLAETFAVH